MGWKLPATDAVEQFWRHIEPFASAYVRVAFCYLAGKEMNGDYILRGRLHLALDLVTFDRQEYQSPSVRAGQFVLDQHPEAIHRLLVEIGQGKVSTPHGDLRFDHPDGVNSEIIYLHPEAIGRQERLSMLLIEGSDQRLYFEHPAVDWELKAGHPPYGDLADLAREYNVGPLPGRSPTIDVVAPQVARMQPSRVDGTSAFPTMRASRHLDRRQLSLGLIVMKNAVVQSRETIPGADLTWKDIEGAPDIVEGSYRLDIPVGAVVNCIPTYSGLAQHFFWIFDPRTIQNPRRAILEAFDPQLEVLLKGLIADGKKGSARQEDFERSIVAILWLMGFAVNPVGSHNLLKDAPDIVGQAPSGNFLLVECTTGLLKQNSKLANLHLRVADAKKRLAVAGIGAFRVLPVMVTQLSREQVATELSEAERDGVRVFVQEDLQQIVQSQTWLSAGPDALYEEQERYLNELQNGPSPPL